MKVKGLKYMQKTCYIVAQTTQKNLDMAVFASKPLTLYKEYLLCDMGAKNAIYF